MSRQRTGARFKPCPRGYNTKRTTADKSQQTTRSAGGDEARDTTFDDLMDLANFDGNMGDDGNNNNSTADLDFDALFN